MLQRVKEWWEKRKHIKRAIRFAEGYDFALEGLRRGDETITSLESMVDCSRSCEAFDDFDEGVLEAIETYRKNPRGVHHASIK